MVRGVETLSDHRYIRMTVSPSGQGSGDMRPVERPRVAKPPPRWALRRLDTEALEVAALVTTWQTANITSAAEGAQWLGDAMVAICDYAMPRVRWPPARRAMYWWSDDIARMRRECVRACHQYTNARRR